MADEMGLGKTVGSNHLSSRSPLTAIAPMHYTYVDAVKAVPGSRQDNNTEMCNSMSFKFGPELGQ